jgi:hypothetical protein
MTGCCKCGDESAGSGVKELVNDVLKNNVLQKIIQNNTKPKQSRYTPRRRLWGEEV